MIAKFFRQIQAILLPLKIIFLLVLAVLISLFIIYTPPTLENIITVSVILFFLLETLLSFFLSTHSSLLISLGVSFVLFLRAVNLLTFVNIILLALFLFFLSIYLQKR